MTTQTQAGRVLGRYLTMGGATVQVTRHDDLAERRWSGEIVDCRWACLACLDGSFDEVRPDYMARHEAAEHAGTCRAMPPENAVLVSPREMTELRAEVTVLGGRVAELAADRDAARDQAAETVAALVAIAERLADRSVELDRVTAAVDGLAATIQDAVQDLARRERSRRCWWGRRSAQTDTHTDDGAEAQA